MLRLVKKLGDFRNVPFQDIPALKGPLNIHPSDGEGTDTEIRELRDVLKSLFERCVDSDFNPINYKAHLDQLSGGKMHSQVVLSKDEYGRPSNRDYLIVHAAEIAVQILVRPGKDEVQKTFSFISINISVWL